MILEKVKGLERRGIDPLCEPIYTISILGQPTWSNAPFLSVFVHRNLLLNLLLFFHLLLACPISFFFFAYYYERPPS